MTHIDAYSAFAAHVTTLAASLDHIDYYKLLGVSNQATADEIKRAFHRAAGIYHPDAHRNVDESIQKCLVIIFKRLSEAYRILNDYGRRKRYDSQLSQSGPQRMVETKREKKGPRSPDAKLKTPTGKRCFLQALQDIKRKDYQGAKLNLQLALTYEGMNSPTIKQKIAEVDDLIRKK